MSDEQHTRPIEPPATWPHPQPHAVQPYPSPSPRQTPPGPVTGPIGGAFAHTTMVTRPVGSMHVAVAWVVAVITIGYFLPWAIAATRQRSNTLAIGVLNLLVGWTFIGWIAALVMAVQSEPTQVTNVAYAVAPVVQAGPPSVPPGWYPDHLGVQRYWDGQRWTEHAAP